MAQIDIADNANYSKSGMQCPPGWTDMTATLPNGVEYLPNNIFLKSCLSPINKSCAVIYIEDSSNYNKSGLKCPINFINATSSLPNGAGFISYPNGATFKISCYSCL